MELPSVNNATESKAPAMVVSARLNTEGTLGPMMRFHASPRMTTSTMGLVITRRSTPQIKRQPEVGFLRWRVPTSSKMKPGSQEVDYIQPSAPARQRTAQHSHQPPTPTQVLTYQWD